MGRLSNAMARGRRNWASGGGEPLPRHPSLGPIVRAQVLGVESLTAQLRALPQAAAKKIVREALAAAAAKIKAQILANIDAYLQRITGQYRAAWEKTTIASQPRRRGQVRMGIKYPEREDLGIGPRDPYYYPYAIEYGHAARGRGGRPKGRSRRDNHKKGVTAPKDVPAIPHVRPAVDEHADDLRRLISAEIVAGILATIARERLKADKAAQKLNRR